MIRQLALIAVIAFSTWILGASILRLATRPTPATEPEEQPIAPVTAPAAPSVPVVAPKLPPIRMQAEAPALPVIVLGTKNTVMFRGIVNSSSVTEAELSLIALAARRGSEAYPLYLVLDTPGGEVETGIGLIELAKHIRNLQTITIFAASMGSAIVEGLPGQRLITPFGWLMFHRAAGQFQGQFEVGEVESRLAMAKKLIHRMEVRTASRLQISVAEYKQRALNEYWLDSDDSIADHAADAVVDIVCTKALIDAEQTVEAQSFFGTSMATFSQCPLISSPIKVQ